MSASNLDMMAHFNTPGPALEEWCRAHLTPKDYDQITSSCKGLEVFLQSFPYCARAIKHQVQNNPHWWDEWSHPNFAHDMLKYSKDPQWVELLRFHWDERATRPMKNPHTDLPFPKHNPSPPKLSRDPSLPIHLLDAQHKNMHHWVRMIEYTLQDMPMFSALMDELVLRQVYQHSRSMETLTLRPQGQDALAILARHHDAPISTWQKVLNHALCINHTSIITWLHTAPQLTGETKWMSSHAVGLRWILPHPTTCALTDPQLNDFWNDMYDDVAQKHPVDMQVVAQAIITSLFNLYNRPVAGPELVSQVAPLTLPRLPAAMKLFPHLNTLLKDHNVSMDFCDRVLPFFSNDEKELISSMVLNAPTHALRNSAYVTQWLLEHSLPPSAPESRIKKM